MLQKKDCEIRFTFIRSVVWKHKLKIKHKHALEESEKFVLWSEMMFKQLSYNWTSEILYFE